MSYISTYIHTEHISIQKTTHIVKIHIHDEYNITKLREMLHYYQTKQAHTNKFHFFNFLVVYCTYNIPSFTDFWPYMSILSYLF